MDIPKRSPSGQVVQDGLTPDGIESNPAQPGASTNPLPIQMIDGKSGSVETLDMVQSSAMDDMMEGPGPSDKGMPEDQSGEDTMGAD